MWTFSIPTLPLIACYVTPKLGRFAQNLGTKRPWNKGPNNPGFFLTSAAKKTKTQAQNSSQKLKKKLNLREAVSSLQEKLKEKTQF